MMKLMKSMVEAITRPIKNFIICYIRNLVGLPSLNLHDYQLDDHHMTLIIEDSNELYGSTQAYLFAKLNLDSLNFYDDVYQGVEFKWRIFVDRNSGNTTKECFKLSFDKRHKDLVYNSYLPFVESKGKEMNESKKKKRILEMNTYSHCYDTWEFKNLENNSTFETIVMKEELKCRLIEDLDRFIRRKDFYIKVGRPWTINYLIHGPPGTGKTSLVAAMANYLNFDVYDLNLSGVVKSDFDPRRLILEIMGNSILVVEDIDCSLEGSTSVLALSQLLSCLSGVWSTGEARVVIFTTNDMERVDPTLLCRMHMKIHMPKLSTS